MSKDLILLDTSNVPAHIRAAMAEGSATNALSAGIQPGFPRLTYKGKVWALNEGGERKPLLNEDGDARSSIEVVIVGASPSISKVYYRGGYVEGSTDAPLCMSHDGIAPSDSSKEKQAAKCQLCPHNQWGSKITESGAKAKACTDSRRIAVAAVGDLTRPIFLRIPAATLKALAVYGQQLSRRGVPVHTVITRIRFDPAVAHPQMVFTATRYVTDAELADVQEAMASDSLDYILQGGDDAEYDVTEGGEIAGTPPTGAKPLGRPRVTPAPVTRQQVIEVMDAEAAPFDPAPAPAPKPAAPKAADPAAAAPAKSRQLKVLEEASELDDILGALKSD